MVARVGKPTIFVDDLYGGSGQFLIDYSHARRAEQPVSSVSSSRFEDVVAVIRCFEKLGRSGVSAEQVMAACEKTRKQRFRPQRDVKIVRDEVQLADVGRVLKKLKSSTILLVGRRRDDLAKAIQASCGTKVMNLDFPEVSAAYGATDDKRAAEIADRWIAAAAKGCEPNREEIVKSAKMYLAQTALMEKYNAQAISINCLGGFYGGHMEAYPCLGFCQLNNDGLVGGCEADLRSAFTMLAMGYLTGRPGYISDPVIDTSKNMCIYAHCVAPTKVFGPDGSSNPYAILTHSEDRRGASMRSYMPLERMTTSLELDPAMGESIVHQGVAVANLEIDRACRTKLAAEVVGDIDKLMREWDRWSWHRVTVYGDLIEPVKELSKAMGLKLTVEA
jgi:L-fucose isomerase-like protein